MIDAFCFDLDGTLQDSEVLYVEAWQQVYRAKGCTVSPDRALAMIYGRANGEIFESFSELCPCGYADLREAISVLETHLARAKDGKDIRIASSIRLLHDLSRRRPVCVVSGSERRHVAEAVARCGVAEHIKFFLGREDYAHGKPDPGCYLTAAQRLGVSPSRCLAFEDSRVGVGAAKQAGMYCVALARPGTPPQDVSAADLILADLADFDPSPWGAHVNG
jgi:HAD superfamily hydrolase (TIGR01509 family)